MSDVHVCFRKWPARPHWEYDAVQLGQDEHGVWLGAPAGTRLSRPGADFWCPGAFVVLLPTDAAFVATFYDHLTPVPTGWVDDEDEFAATGSVSSIPTTSSLLPCDRANRCARRSKRRWRRTTVWPACTG